MNSNEGCIVFFDRLMEGKYNKVTKEDWFYAREHWKKIRAELIKDKKSSHDIIADGIFVDGD